MITALSLVPQVPRTQWCDNTFLFIFHSFSFSVSLVKFMCVSKLETSSTACFSQLPSEDSATLIPNVSGTSKLYPLYNGYLYIYFRPNVPKQCTNSPLKLVVTATEGPTTLSQQAVNISPISFTSMKAELGKINGDNEHTIVCFFSFVFPLCFPWTLFSENQNHCRWNQC